MLIHFLFALSMLAAAQSLEVSPQDQQIWLVRPQGGRVQLIRGPQNASAPAWSFDHKAIAYFRYCLSPAQCDPALVLIELDYACGAESTRYVLTRAGLLPDRKRVQ